MRARWVAGSVRGRLLASRRLGRDGARAVAGAGDLDAALAVVARSPYGHDVSTGMTALEARRGVSAACLWHLRILAGWLDPRGAELVRVLGAGFELANVEDRAATLEGGPSVVPLEVGALGIAWARAASAETPARLREVLRSSPWGDPGGESAVAIGVAMRLAWARLVLDGVPLAEEWAAGAAALVVAREALAFGRALPEPARSNARDVLGRRWAETSWATLDGLRSLLPREASWVFDDVAGADELWLAEAGWWRRVERDATALLSGGTRGTARRPVEIVGAVALLLVDAWRTRAALEAARAGPIGSGVFDAVA